MSVRAFLALAVVLASAADAAGQSREVLEFVGTSKGKPVQMTAALYLPEAATGRLPAMVIQHGSGGVSEAREHAYAREFVKMGVAAVVTDSFSPRGVKSTVTDQSAVSSLEMTRDALNALAAASKHPRIDGGRIGIVGFSKGGTVALQTALDRFTLRALPSGPRFALHVAMYPGCGSHHFNPATSGAPILMMMGDADTYTGVEACLALAERYRAAGAKVETRVFPGAKHGWDSGGAAYSIAKGENFRDCVFEQQADGGWIEKKSGVRTHGAGEKPIPGAIDSALAACRTYGVSGGPDPETRAASLTLVKQAMRAALRLD